MQNQTSNTQEQFPFQGFTGMHEVEVTPSVAKFWLKNTPPNKQRRLNKAEVAKCVKLINDGEFKGADSNDLVCISPGHEVVNGQHRLNAIVQTNTTQKLNVKFNAPWNAFHTIDRGKKRSLGDDFDVNGRVGAYASMVNAIYSMTMGSKSSLKVPLEVAENIHDALQNDLSWIHNIWKQYKKQRVTLLQSYSMAAFVLAHHKYPQQTEEFVLKYLTGVNCTAGEPALILRDTFLNGGRRGYSKDPAWVVGFKTLQALDKAVKNETMKRIRPVESEQSMHNVLSTFTTPLFNL